MTFTTDQLITEINSQVALFRDLLIHIGTSRDCPELREKIRKLRRTCVDACKHTSQLLLPQIRRWKMSDTRQASVMTSRTLNSDGGWGEVDAR
ncbi:hypothetical protein LSTR_LSTR008847 [Laodelphax striatellus]|uniref:Syntaxin N-terminal domain-containing protein n=1 Tax=Laodelphax striatellus TaxID=195883 RepID=A0A482WTB9_LAOST|nr:hypothetical protein LSTR_LSTR008847 [Laodelphax striatellus]